MSEQSQPRTLVTTLRDALQKLESALELTRDGVDEIDAQAARLREDIAALGTLRQREDTSVSIDMVIDAAMELLQAFSSLELALPDAQAEVDILEGELAEDENA